MLKKIHFIFPLSIVTRIVEQLLKWPGLSSLEYNCAINRSTSGLLQIEYKVLRIEFDINCNLQKDTPTHSNLENGE